MNGYDVMARVLQAEGVEFLAAFHHQTLIDAAAKIGIRPIICRQERAGVNIADGFSRVSNGRNFGVFTMQQGPGSENAFAGVAQAYADSVPMLHLPGGERLPRLGINPTFDAVTTYTPITKWAARIHRIQDIPTLMRTAITRMRSGNPGPVLLEMPVDVMTQDFPEEDFSYYPVQHHLSMASPKDIEGVVGALLDAKEPVIVAGQGILYAQATPELIEFAELTNTPVMTTLAGKSAFPEDHALSLGTGGHSCTPAVSHFLGQMDFGLGVGTSFTRNTFTTPMPDGVVLAQVTNCPEDIGKDYEVAYASVGDAKLVLRQMIEEVKNHLGDEGAPDNRDVVGRLATLQQKFQEDWNPRFNSEEVPISPYRVFQEIKAACGTSNTIITHDSGYPRDQLVPTWNTNTPRGYLGWGKSTQLGYGMGLAIGAKLAAPQKTVVNVMGDAAFGMGGMDLETAVREEIPIITVVLNNGVMTKYDSHMPTATTRYASNALGGNYAQVAEGLGAHAERVETPNDLSSAFQRSLDANREGKPALVEVVTKVEEVVPG